MELIPKAYACTPYIDYVPPEGYRYYGMPICGYYRTFNIFTLEALTSIVAGIFLGTLLFFIFTKYKLIYRILISFAAGCMAFEIFMSNFDFLLPWRVLPFQRNYNEFFYIFYKVVHISTTALRVLVVLSFLLFGWYVIKQPFVDSSRKSLVKSKRNLFFRSVILLYIALYWVSSLLSL